MNKPPFTPGKNTFRKNLTTAYIFLLISVVFYLLFFLNAQELPVIGAAFLCDAAALIYIVRAVKAYPFENH